MAREVLSLTETALNITGLVCECTKERGLATLCSKLGHVFVSSGSTKLLFLVLVVTKADVQEWLQPDTALAVPAQDLGAV